MQLLHPAFFQTLHAHLRYKRRVSRHVTPTKDVCANLTQRIVRIVCVSRLVYRKGIDLLLGALPRICAMHENVEFLIGSFTSDPKEECNVI